MRALDAAVGHRTAEAPLPAGTAGPSDGSGFYLTNEVFLYRVVGLVASGVDELVELEDCYGLEVVRVPVRELRERRLRLVTPAPANG